MYDRIERKINCAVPMMYNNYVDSGAIYFQCRMVMCGAASVLVGLQSISYFG